MSLPRSVRKQAKAAADFYEKPAGDEPQDPALKDGNQEPAGADPVKPDAEAQEQPSEPKPKDEPNKDEDRDAAYWRHRHNVIEGKYRAEVPKLHTEIRELKDAIAEKDRELEQAKQASPAASPQGDLTDEQLAEFKEAFGEEVVDFVSRMVAQKAGNAPDDKVEELESRLSRFEQEKAEDAEARFWADLEEAVPKYLTINQDPTFLRWLGEFNPNTGQTYQDDLVSAQHAGNARGVAKVFKLFLKQSPGTEQEPAKKQVPEEDIEPRASGNSTPPPAGRGRTWSGADISDFYRDRMKGKFSKEEAERLEADIFAAQKEGRVTR